MVHQTFDTVDHVASGDPRFQDRGLFNVHSTGGDFLLQLGFGVYPNQNMIDAWTAGVHNDQQYNLRVSRPMDHDRSDLNLGQIHVDVVRPMQEWRLWVDDNDYGVQFDLVFHARTPAFEFRPVFIRRDNAVEHHQVHVLQSGTYDGWVRIGDHQFEGPFIGSRDRSWGVRGPQPGQPFDKKSNVPLNSTSTGAGGPASVRTSRAWIAAEFADYAIHGWFLSESNGNPLIADGAIIDAESGATRRRFDSWGPPNVVRDAQDLPEALELTLFDEQRVETPLLARPLISRCPDANGYYKGSYGRKRTELHIEGEAWDMSLPSFRRDFGYMNGTMLAEFRCGEDVGYGILITPLMERNR
ncbi:hypothetical protein MXD63_33165 [Frankia sp. Cpl3]|nr:hypothetical protein [Frankia sp. Cpl3]